MYSQFFQIREVLEYIGWQLRDVVHAQVTVETRTRVRNTATSSDDFASPVVRTYIF